MHHDNNRRLLETLIDTVYDSLEGYRRASETARSPQIKDAFTQQMARRRDTLDRLNQELVRQGGELVTKGTLTGTLHQTWLAITDLFGDDDKTAVERVEEGEDYLAGKFEAALEDDDLTPETRAVITAAYAEIREGERLADRLSLMAQGTFGRD